MIKENELNLAYVCKRCDKTYVIKRNKNYVKCPNCCNEYLINTGVDIYTWSNYGKDKKNMIIDMASNIERECYIYVCKSCKKAFKVSGVNKKVNCTNCHSELENTNVSIKEWKFYNAEEKNDIVNPLTSEQATERINVLLKELHKEVGYEFERCDWDHKSILRRFRVELSKDNKDQLVDSTYRALAKRNADLNIYIQDKVKEIDRECKKLLKFNPNEVVFKKIYEMIRYMNVQSEIDYEFEIIINGEKFPNNCKQTYNPEEECKEMCYFWKEKIPYSLRDTDNTDGLPQGRDLMDAICETLKNTMEPLTTYEAYIQMHGSKETSRFSEFSNIMRLVVGKYKNREIIGKVVAQKRNSYMTEYYMPHKISMYINMRKKHDLGSYTPKDPKAENNKLKKEIFDVIYNSNTNLSRSEIMERMKTKFEDTIKGRSPFYGALLGLELDGLVGRDEKGKECIGKYDKEVNIYYQ